MNKEIKKAALAQYFSYFKFWFLILVIFIAGVILAYTRRVDPVSGNSQAPAERVYDYADVLTEKEEQSLRDLISTLERDNQIHIVLVTENKFIPYGEEYSAIAAADDFYDQNNYGFNKVHGDGFLLYDFHVDEKGKSYTWLSTCGKVEKKFGDMEIDSVLAYCNESSYACYKKAIEKACQIASNDGFLGQWYVFPIAAVIAVIVSLCYAAANLHQKKAKDTTTTTTYMGEGVRVIGQTDQFLRKHVTSTRIETNSGSRSGGGGHHVSHGGVSHGGGGRRH